jgi:hypothetical protein
LVLDKPEVHEQEQRDTAGRAEAAVSKPDAVNGDELVLGCSTGSHGGQGSMRAANLAFAVAVAVAEGEKMTDPPPFDAARHRLCLRAKAEVRRQVIGAF